MEYEGKLEDKVVDVEIEHIEETLGTRNSCGGCIFDIQNTDKCNLPISICTLESNQVYKKAELR